MISVALNVIHHANCMLIPDVLAIGQEKQHEVAFSDLRQLRSSTLTLLGLLDRIDACKGHRKKLLDSLALVKLILRLGVFTVIGDHRFGVLPND